MKSAILLALIAASVSAEPPREIVYIWKESSIPTQVFMQDLGKKVTVYAVSPREAYVLLADTARAAHCNGVISLQMSAKPDGRTEARAKLVTFRDPGRLKLTLFYVME